MSVCQRMLSSGEAAPRMADAGWLDGQQDT